MSRLDGTATAAEAAAMKQLRLGGWLAIAAIAGCASSKPDQPPVGGIDAGTIDATQGIATDAAIDAAPPAGGKLRIVASNLTSGNGQAYEAPGIRILRGVAADIALIQEFNVDGNTPAQLRSFVDQAFGSEFSFVRGAATQQIPNGIVSRYPIRDSGEWLDTEVGNRAFTWAKIDIPGPVDLYAISVHLLTASASVRNLEAAALVQQIQGLPAGAYVTLGGDFNTDTRSEPGITTLSAVLATAAPHPADQNGDGDTNASRGKPYDWVLASPALHALATPVVIGSRQFASGLVVDTRVHTPLADLAPAQQGDSGAPMMQHMAVVRDFALPGAPQDRAVQVTAPNGGETWVAGSSQTIRWMSSGVDNVSVELSTDGATWTTLSASTAAAAGQLATTAPATATMAARVRVTGVPGGMPSDTSDAPFTITVAPGASRVFFNEVLADEPGSAPAGEFVELVNSGTGDADLSSCTISDAGQVRHVFAAGTMLRAGRALVVYGGATGIPDGVVAIAASTGGLNLSNGGDTVTLACSGTTVDAITYTSVLSNEDGVSMNRSPDGSPGGTLVLHTALVAAQRSPGTRADGSAF